MENGNSNTLSGQRVNEEAVPGNSAEVDLQALAEEIVALLKEELRVENERRGRR
ncbi:MAG TPA: hypothetical protein PKZ84_07105 [Anaerolineae bacterium]|nr:hypothetical protein [Anaerolineae bacterium]HQI84241.1 hypothetical protein [Anaerolineae bacterium]